MTHAGGSIDLTSRVFTVDDIERPGGRGLAAAAQRRGNATAGAALAAADQAERERRLQAARERDAVQP